AVVAEGDVAAALRHPGAPAPLLLSVLDLLRHQHGSILRYRAPLGRGPPTLFLEQVALVHPDLDADDPVGGARFGEAVIDVGLQGVERQAAFLIPLGARDLGAAQAARDHDLDPLGAEAEGRLHRLLHRPAEGDAALELAGDRLAHELRVELGTLDLLDVDVDLAPHLLLEVVAQL